MAETDSMDAAEALARADGLRDAVNRRSRWLVRYQLAYGVTSFAMVLALGLFEGAAGVVVSMALWVPAIVALTVYAARQPSRTAAWRVRTA
ncbi:hypothetical protein ACFQHO_02820 [Actinomadura yumaensis]|uniref:hypothetical protein n=1 Tax=Actinomadura yumaensis TaxID=111807 RepID=UPI0036214A62